MGLVHFDIRISTELLNLIKGIAVEHGITVGELTRFLINNSLENIDKSGLDNEIQLRFMKNEQRSTNSKLYLVKNMYKRILDMAMSSYFITKGINMKSINLALDIYIKIFNLYDEKIKKAIGTDFHLTVKRLRNQNFLLEQSNAIRKLRMIEKR